MARLIKTELVEVQRPFLDCVNYVCFRIQEAWRSTENIQGSFPKSPALRAKAIDQQNILEIVCSSCYCHVVQYVTGAHLSPKMISVFFTASFGDFTCNCMHRASDGMENLSGWMEQAGMHWRRRFYWQFPMVKGVICKLHIPISSGTYWT